MAPARLADDVLRGVVGLPQERRGWALPGFGGWSGTRSTLIPVAAVVAIGLLVALLGLVYATRPQPVLPGFRVGAVVDRRSGVGRDGHRRRGRFARRGDHAERRGLRGHHLALDRLRRDLGAPGGSDAVREVVDRRLPAAGPLGARVRVAPRRGRHREDRDLVVRGWGIVAPAVRRGIREPARRPAARAPVVSRHRRSRLRRHRDRHRHRVRRPNRMDLHRRRRVDSRECARWHRHGGPRSVPAGFLALTWSDRITSSTSPDGITWSPATFPDTVPCCGSGAMANLPGGMPLGAVAVIPGGAGAAMRPSAFVTRGAEAWSPLELPAPPEPCVTTASWRTCPLIATAVAADADHLVVAGSTALTQAGPLQAVFWTSADARPNVDGEHGNAVADARSDAVRRPVARRVRSLGGWPERVLCRRRHAGRGCQRVDGPPLPAERPVTEREARHAERPAITPAVRAFATRRSARLAFNTAEEPTIGSRSVQDVRRFPAPTAAVHAERSGCAWPCSSRPAQRAAQPVSWQGGAGAPERAHPQVRERGADATTPPGRRISGAPQSL